MKNAISEAMDEVNQLEYAMGIAAIEYPDLVCFPNAIPKLYSSITQYF